MENVTHRGLSEERIKANPSPTRPPFGRLLKRFRQAAGLSQEALAERAGLSWRTISDLERGVKQGPRGTTLRLLVEALALGTEERTALQGSAHPPDAVVAAQAALPPAPAGVPTNLPLPLTSFVGREQELATVRRLLGEARLVTLTGAGGCGKTRLALEVARALAHEGGNLVADADGIWLVELAALSDGTLVPRALATVLGIRERRDQALLDTLADFLRPKRALILLDNCEHLLAACAQMADALLQVCPRLAILATSREALRIGGEQPWRVPSFALPAPLARLTLEQTLARDAVRLCVQRAQVVQPDFSVTVQNMALVTLICRRLDGMPLAIELAAARLSALTLDQIAARLDDRFRLLTGGSRTALPRQQTLRATLDWSYDLLDEAERLLWRRLSVFAGGWTLESAEAICVVEGIVAEEVLDLLAGLVNKSLVVLEAGKTSSRYRLLEMVRQYGREQLGTDEEAAVRDRHLAWYLALSRQAASHMGGVEREGWLERLEEELENLRAALDWSALEEARRQEGLQLAAALEDFWYMRGYASEGRRRLEELLASVGSVSTTLRAHAIAVIALLAYYRADYGQAVRCFDAAHTLHLSEGNVGGATWMLHYQIIVAIALGEYRQAELLIERVLPAHREHGDRHGIGWALSHLATIQHLQGEKAGAVALYEESLATFQEVGDKYPVGSLLCKLASVVWEQGNTRRAARLYRESLLVRQALLDQTGLAECFEGLATVAALEHPERAARLFGAAHNLRERTGTPMGIGERATQDRAIAELRAGLDEDIFASAWAAGQAIPLEEAVELALEDGPSAEE